MGLAPSRKEQGGVQGSDGVFEDGVQQFVEAGNVAQVLSGAQERAQVLALPRLTAVIA